METDSKKSDSQPAAPVDATCNTERQTSEQPEEVKILRDY